ncbi:MAG: ACP S-malonyltransferase [Planctomycetota bacterium]|nr:MAG: ACP S-malonyltransferase [Planctomycetota bacterium]
MPKTAILFAGQGAQSVGMGRDIAESSSPAAEIFERANEVVGYDIKKLCFEGPPEKLEQTDIQQPAIFTTSAAIWQALNSGRGIGEAPVAMAGLSLGEYTALYAAGSVDFDDALRLVKRRGELMQAASNAIPGGMVTALGLDPGKVQSICQAASSAGTIGPANFNCPGQIVISGAGKACDLAEKLIEEASGRAVRLKVAGAFHSPLMKPAAESLAQILADTPFETPKIPIIANVNCEFHGQAVNIRQWLTDQLTQPIRWQESMERLISQGVEQFIEIGPGKVLTGLMRKIDRKIPVINLSTADALTQVAA